MSEVSRTAEVLRRVSNFLRTLSDDQIEDLIAGRVNLTLAPEPGRRRQRSKVDTPDVSMIQAELQSRMSREEGMEYLESLSLTRPSLQAIAAAMDLPTPRGDSVARLKERILEATIGYRLRSEAIRSRDSSS